MASRYRSPLRYPGGKARFTRYLQRVFEENKLSDGEYAEPYAGGAGIALGLLYTEYASRVHINDLDRSVFAFWYSALHHTGDLCRLVMSVPLTVDEWRRQRSVQVVKADADLLELGFSTFFLNRVNRSGIIGSGGVIGGVEQRGRWGIGARFNRSDLVRRIKRVASYRDRIYLYNLDALDFLALAAGTLAEKSLVYLDPPYFVKGQRKLYASFYRAEDHVAVASALDACPWPWIVSYDATPEILRLYRGRRRITYDIDYTAAVRYKGSEAMFFSPDLHIPQELWPAVRRAS